MRSLICLLIGYVFGSLSPAALVSGFKNKDLRQEGTGNLGATNTIIVMGKKLGLMVMLLDIFKSFLAAKVAAALFSEFSLAGLIAAWGAVLGHIYSMFLHFHGGKGVAAFAGMIIYYKPVFFFILAGIAIFLMLVTNLGVVGPASAALLFPVLVYEDCGSLSMALICAAAGFMILFTHLDNIRKIKAGDEILVGTFLHKVLFSHSHKRN